MPLYLVTRTYHYRDQEQYRPEDVFAVAADSPEAALALVVGGSPPEAYQLDVRHSTVQHEVPWIELDY